MMANYEMVKYIVVMQRLIGNLHFLLNTSVKLFCKNENNRKSGLKKEEHLHFKLVFHSVLLSKATCSRNFMEIMSMHMVMLPSPWQLCSVHTCIKSFQSFANAVIDRYPM